MKIILALFILFFISFSIMPSVYAATTPSLGTADSFVILSSTYTNTVGGTTLTGDLGYTTGPAMAPTVSGTTHIANGTYSSAGTDQGTALSSLAAQTCDFTYGSATDLSLLSQPLAAGVYCITGATSIGSGGITLNASGTYIFRIVGALTSVSSSIVTISGSASACNVFWTPTQATTLGANSTFAGTDIDAAGITIGSTVTWVGRALAFGGTVSTDVDTISVPSCPAPTPTPTPTPIPTATPASTSSSSSSSSSTSSTSTSSSSSSVGGETVAVAVTARTSNPLVPGFPDTGFDPNGNNISRIIPVGLFLIFFIFNLAI